MVGGLNSSQAPPETVWLAFDEAWSFENSTSFNVPARVDALEAGPSLRFITTRRAVESFYAQFGEHFRPFTLSGSGDFHHLTAVFIRQIKEPFAILSFDNHPDWDVRPPHWSCGAWVNRALENPLVQEVAVWGCGSFECGFPWRLLGNRSACRSGRLRVAPWRADGQSYPSWLHPISPADWRQSFGQFVESIPTPTIYVTVDLDCLGESDAVTNWENGRFALLDLVWAITFLRQKVRIVGGDLCGAFSPMRYGSRFQSLAGRFDHPRQRAVTEKERRRINLRALETIWPHLVGEDGKRVGVSA
jgi:arginase family enzyme